MKVSQVLSSVFRTIELSMMALIAFGATNWIFWLVWSIALVLDIFIDDCIRSGK